MSIERETATTALASEPWTVRVAVWSARHRFPVFAAWFVLVFGLMYGASAMGGQRSQSVMDGNDVSIGESDAGWRAFNDADDRTAASKVDTEWFYLIVSNPKGQLGAADKTAIAAMTQRLGQLTATIDGRTVPVFYADSNSPLPAVVNPYDLAAAAPDQAPGVLSADGTTAIITANISGDDTEATAKAGVIKPLAAEFKSAYPNLTIYAFNNRLINEEFGNYVNNSLDSLLLPTLLVTFLILLVAARSLVAAFVPLVLAMTAITGAMGLVGIYSQTVAPVSQYVSQIVVLIGLAVAVDYSLFVISRFRTERGRGNVSLAGLRQAGCAWLVRDALRSPRAGGPGPQQVRGYRGRQLHGRPRRLLQRPGGHDLAGRPAADQRRRLQVDRHRFDLGRSHLRRRQPDLPAGDAGHPRPLGRSLRRPGPRPRSRRRHGASGARSSAPPPTARSSPRLRPVCCSWPSPCRSRGSSSAPRPATSRTLPHSVEGVRAWELLTREVAAGPRADDRGHRHRRQGAADRGRHRDVLRRSSGGQDCGGQRHLDRHRLLGRRHGRRRPRRHPRHGQRPLQLEPGPRVPLERRAELLRRISPSTKVYVSGEAAFTMDYANWYGGQMPLVILFVLGMSFLLLLVAFHSIVIPLKAIILNLLSAGAAFGVLVLLFQEGWFKDITGIRPNVIEAWAPAMIFTILFGLSMDYHVFILTRVKEARDRGLASTDAVVKGITITAGTVTSAAAIMVCVFGAFYTVQLAIIQELGIGLAVAVLVDATLVRSLLLPSLMKLLGEWNWWMPGFLHWIPRIIIEGEPEDRLGDGEAAGTAGA